jgi:helicase MOV-10
VSVTRAKALLIVVGNPAILGLDPLWRAFLNWVYVRGGWAGPHPPWDPKGEGSPEAAFDAADVNAKVEVDAARHGELDEDDSESDAPDELLWRPEDD